MTEEQIEDVRQFRADCKARNIKTEHLTDEKCIEILNLLEEV